MPVNTLKDYKKEDEGKRPTAKKTGSFFWFVEHYVKLGIIFENGLPVRYIPYILFVAGLGIFYIGNIHYAEKTVRKVNRLKTEVDDLRSEYTTLRANYDFASKQSEVARRVTELGLQESSSPPYKIVLKKE